MSHIAKSSLIIAVFFAVDKVLGFIRQVFVARQFGLTYEIDVFNAANNIPDLLSALISGGAQRWIVRFFAQHARKINIIGGLLLIGVGLYDLITNLDLIRTYLGIWFG